MKNPDLSARLSLTMQRKHWFRLQAILAILDSHGFSEGQLKIISVTRSKFNRALQSANAEQLRAENESPEERRT